MAHLHRFALLGCLAALCAITPATASADLVPTVSSLTTKLIGGGCGSTSQAFAGWGDARSYYFTSEGGFEARGAGWTLAGKAKVVSGNETFFVHGSSDRSSLLIPSGSSATSPSLCFGLLYPGVRFLARSTSGSGTINVQVIARGLLGVLTQLDGGTVSVGSTWAPTPVLDTTFSQLNVPVGTKSIQLKLTASSGDVQVDDIYIDPFCSH